MLPQKSEDYKISALQYYLSKNKNQVQTCKIFQCHPRSLSVQKNINQKIRQENKEKLSINRCFKFPKV